MFCAISGQVVQTAVFAPKTGLIYEERLIKKALENEGGKCPVTGTILNAEDDLVPVKASPLVLPRPPASTSFPSLLTTLQNEWDSLILEQISLRKELLETRKDLASALYEREAATSVIARLLKENQELKAQLSSAPALQTEAKQAGVTDMDMDIDESVLREIVETEAKLQKKRTEMFKKGMKPGSEGIALLSGETKWKEVASLSPHKSSPGGVTCIGLNSFSVLDNAPTPFPWVVSGGKDGDVKIIDSSVGQVVGTLSGHKGGVNEVNVLNNLVTSASQDKSVMVWSGDWPASSGQEVELKLQYTIKFHSKAVSACPIHPCGRFAASAGMDGNWSLLDLEKGTIIFQNQVKDDKFTCARFHPDGKLFSTAGSQGIVNLFNFTADPSKGPAAQLNHEAAINHMAFSENGYIVATAGADGQVKVWDLRKIAVVASLSTISQDSAATAVDFDSSGNYLAFADSQGGIGVSLKPEKKGGEWSTIVKMFEHKKSVTAVKFTSGAAGLWTGSLDRTLKHFEFQ